MASDYCTGGLITPNYECGGPERIRMPISALTEKRQNKIREINITQLDYGYIVKVGCKTFALDTPDKILFALKQYFRNPENTEHQFTKGTLKFEK